MVEVSLTVGKLDASLALLLTKDHHLIEFPTILLPNGVRAGSIVKIKCDQDLESEKEEAIKFQNIQDDIFKTFATNAPQAPKLRVKNVTQTSCVLEWDQLLLGTANLKNLILFKDGVKLGSIPQPLTNRTSKLSGLPIDKLFKFQLRLDTTAGTFMSEEIEIKTHKMTDLSGVTVCIGDLSPNDPFSRLDIEEALVNMGAKHPSQDQVKVDTTHYLCTRENKQNPEYIKANDMNIPIIRPEWLKACERERRLVGVREFYVKECVLPDLFAKNYWAKPSGGANANVGSGVNPGVDATNQQSTSVKASNETVTPSINVENAEDSQPKEAREEEEKEEEKDKKQEETVSQTHPETDKDLKEENETKTNEDKQTEAKQKPEVDIESEFEANTETDDKVVPGADLKQNEPVVDPTHPVSNENFENSADSDKDDNTTEGDKVEVGKEIDDAFDDIPVNEIEPTDVHIEEPETVVINTERENRPLVVAEAFEEEEEKEKEKEKEKNKDE